jgi:hypothetical protein
MTTLEATRIAVWWGPGVLLLLVFGFGFLKLAKYWIEKSMEVKRQQMESWFSMARLNIEQFLSTQQCQADALTRLATSVERRDSTEGFEHQEILISLKALHRDVELLLQRQQRESVA